MQLSAIHYNSNNKNLNFEGVKQKTVAKVVQKNKTEIIKEDVAEYINAGFSYKDLAEFYHCGIETILEKLRDFGLIKENEKNNKGQIINITKDELQELVLKGLKIKDMAQKFNCSEHAIRDRLNKFELMDKYKEINNINTDINISKKCRNFLRLVTFL